MGSFWACPSNSWHSCWKLQTGELLNVLSHQAEISTWRFILGSHSRASMWAFQSADPILGFQLHAMEGCPCEISLGAGLGLGVCTHFGRPCCPVSHGAALTDSPSEAAHSVGCAVQAPACGAAMSGCHRLPPSVTGRGRRAQVWPWKPPLGP